jgi:hypothetical protein
LKSIRALLVDPQAKPEFILADADENHRYPISLVKPKRGKTAIGYKTKMARMCRGGYHLVAVSKLGGIVLNVNDDRVWEVLTGPGYTTPLLREWMPEIVRHLTDRRLLAVSEGFNASVGVLDLDGEMLDNIVSELVRIGTLRLCA